MVSLVFSFHRANFDAVALAKCEQTIVSYCQVQPKISCSRGSALYKEPVGPCLLKSLQFHSSQSFTFYNLLSILHLFLSECLTIALVLAPCFIDYFITSPKANAFPVIQHTGRHSIPPRGTSALCNTLCPDLFFCQSSFIKNFVI